MKLVTVRVKLQDVEHDELVEFGPDDYVDLLPVAAMSRHKLSQEPDDPRERTAWHVKLRLRGGEITGEDGPVSVSPATWDELPYAAQWVIAKILGGLFNGHEFDPPVPEDVEKNAGAPSSPPS